MPVSTLPYVMTDVDPSDRESWLKARRAGVGGSDVASIIGISPWKSEYALWAEKVGLIEPEDISGRDEVMWGTLLEPVVRDHFAEMHPNMSVMKPDVMYRSVKRPWAQATLDGKIFSSDGEGILEIKTTDARNWKQWDDRVPDHYVAQVMHYMSVTGYRYAYVAVLIGGNDYREYRIDWNDEDIALVEDAVDKFWQHVVQRKPPVSIDGSASTHRALFFEHREPSGGIEDVGETPTDAIRYMTARENEKSYREEASLMAARLKRRIGDAKGFETPDLRVTWIRTKVDRLDTKRLKEERPDVYAEYCEKVDRDMGLRIKRLKEE